MSPRSTLRDMLDSFLCAEVLDQTYAPQRKSGSHWLGATNGTHAVLFLLQMASFQYTQPKVHYCLGRQTEKAFMKTEILRKYYKYQFTKR